MTRSSQSNRRDASGREDRWYVARVHPGAERIAEENLVAQGFGVFCPVVTPDRKTKTGATPAKIPLFPGYICIMFDIAFDTNWPAINNTRGVKRLLPTMRERPIAISTAFVEHIMARVDAKDFEPDEVGDIISRFVVGHEYRIVDGPFASFPGVFTGRTGDSLNLEAMIFGRPTPITLAVDQVERPPAPAEPCNSNKAGVSAKLDQAARPHRAAKSAGAEAVKR